MFTVIVGPGALGCLLATRLYLAQSRQGRAKDHDLVCLLDYDQERAAKLNRQGIFLEETQRPPAGLSTGPTGSESAISHGPLKISVSADPALVAKAGLILLCVKAFALPQALTRISPFLAPGALLIALQNGISHLEALRQMSAKRLRALGVSTEGANLTAPGRVRSSGVGLTKIGYLATSPCDHQQNQDLDQSQNSDDQPQPDFNPSDHPQGKPGSVPPTLLPGDPLVKAAAILNSAGIHTKISDDMQRELWLKLIINAGINALTVIHDCPNGELLKIPLARGAMAAAVREAAAVAVAAGVGPIEDPVALTEEVCRQTATNISSMLQDARRGKPTEIMAINGEVVRLAVRYGLASPVNRELVAKLQLQLATNPHPRGREQRSMKL